MPETLKRYDYYDPSSVSSSGQIEILDRSKGHSLGRIAWTNDIDVAQLLVDLLNKHDQVERTRAAVYAWLAEPTNIREGIDYDD